MSTHPLRSAGIRIGFCTLLLSAAPLTAVAPQQLAAPDDQAIRTQIEARLVDKGFVGVSVDVHGHVATLTGSVASLWSKEQVIEQTRKVRSVADVISKLTIAPGEGDASIAEEIAGDIGASSYYSVFDDVSVRVSGGVAMLTGYVTTATKSREFTRSASQVPGVRQVIDWIEELPASMNDDHIRYAIATSIYGALFPQYINARNGPIHILVQMGHVTLLGHAGSEADRRMAEIFARQVFGVMSVDNELFVARDAD